MDTHERTQEIERIRARVADEYRDAVDAVDLAAHDPDANPFYDLVMADLRTLLSELTRLQAVEAVAGEVVDDGCECMHHFMNGTYSYEVTGAAMDKLHDALKGAGEPDKPSLVETFDELGKLIGPYFDDAPDDALKGSDDAP